MSLDEILEKSTKPVLLQFFATWCGPCKTLSEIMDRAKGEVEGYVERHKIDVDTQSDIAAEFYVRAIPTLVLVDQEGNVLWRHTGVLSAPEIIKEISKT